MSDDLAPRGAVLRNWQPAETIEDYLRNCREGSEEYSERRAAQLLGWPRMKVYRAKLMADIQSRCSSGCLLPAFSALRHWPRSVWRCGVAIPPRSSAVPIAGMCCGCGRPLAKRPGIL